MFDALAASKVTVLLLRVTSKRGAVIPVTGVIACARTDEVPSVRLNPELVDPRAMVPVPPLRPNAPPPTAGKAWLTRLEESLPVTATTILPPPPPPALEE